jgi:hypothetical protein
MAGRSGGGQVRAVRDALSRLGMQARDEAVVAALAGRGVTVSRGFVRQVRFALLKAATDARGPRAPAPLPGNWPPVRCPPKVPPRRGR